MLQTLYKLGESAKLFLLFVVFYFVFLRYFTLAFCAGLTTTSAAQ
jgi:hypothetical protein